MDNRSFEGGATRAEEIMRSLAGAVRQVGDRFTSINREDGGNWKTRAKIGNREISLTRDLIRVIRELEQPSQPLAAFSSQLIPSGVGPENAIPDEHFQQSPFRILFDSLYNRPEIGVKRLFGNPSYGVIVSVISSQNRHKITPDQPWILGSVAFDLSVGEGTQTRRPHHTVTWWAGDGPDHFRAEVDEQDVRTPSGMHREPIRSVHISSQTDEEMRVTRFGKRARQCCEWFGGGFAASPLNVIEEAMTLATREREFTFVKTGAFNQVHNALLYSMTYAVGGCVEAYRPGGKTHFTRQEILTGAAPAVYARDRHSWRTKIAHAFMSGDTIHEETLPPRF